MKNNLNWWEPVPSELAYEWEILPQSAEPGSVILSKRNELGILSNFASTEIKYKDKTYASIEGFWQSLKFPESDADERAHLGAVWPHQRAEVEQMSGSLAKHAGDSASLIMKENQISWVSFQGRKLNYYELAKGPFYQLIFEVTKTKVSQHSQVKELLLKTGNLILKPDHHQEGIVPPAWKYFEIYMEIRKELQIK